MLVLSGGLMAAKRYEFQYSETVTVNTTAKVHTLTGNGDIYVFSNGGTLYYEEDPSGVTPNTDSNYINAGNEVSLGFRYATQKLGILSDSGTITANINYYDWE